MKKPIIQITIIVSSFFLLWFGLYQVDWLKLFEVKKRTEQTEEKLGEQYWQIIKASEDEVSNQVIVQCVDSVLIKLCSANNISRSDIKLHLIDNSEVNAFALPGGHMIINTGLISHSEHQDAVAGVIAHELAHIQLKHVMKKLVREVGLAALLNSAGGGGGDLIKETSKMLTSLAFDRSLETEADLKAVEYMLEAKINPEPMANFLYLLASEHHELMEKLAWISTHPVSQERAELIIEKMNTDIEYQPAISDSTWNLLKEAIKTVED